MERQERFKKKPQEMWIKINKNYHLDWNWQQGLKFKCSQSLIKYYIPLFQTRNNLLTHECNIAAKIGNDPISKKGLFATLQFNFMCITRISLFYQNIRTRHMVSASLSTYLQVSSKNCNAPTTGVLKIRIFVNRKMAGIEKILNQK